MPNLSTTSTQPSPRAAQNEVFVPFVARVRVVPNLATGKRWSYFRNLEKIALRTENDLTDVTGLNIATPVAFTPQFGDFESHLTIVGFVQKSRVSSNPTVDPDRLNTPPTTNIDEIHSGTDPDEKTALIDGNRGGSLAAGQDPVDAVENEVVELRTLLAASTTQFEEHDVIHIEYNGVKYGLKKIGGRSFRG
jgi:hypothetical protein